MNQMVTCINCGNQFHTHHHVLCPNCKQVEITVDPVSGEIIQVHKSQLPQKCETVAAQDRTTHAVRAIAISMIALPIVLSFGYVSLSITSNAGNSSARIICATLFIGALSITSGAALSEFRRSRPY